MNMMRPIDTLILLVCLFTLYFVIDARYLQPRDRQLMSYCGDPVTQTIVSCN